MTVDIEAQAAGSRPSGDWEKYGIGFSYPEALSGDRWWVSHVAHYPPGSNDGRHHIYVNTHDGESGGLGFDVGGQHWRRVEMGARGMLSGGVWVDGLKIAEKLGFFGEGGGIEQKSEKKCKKTAKNGGFRAKLRSFHSSLLWVVLGMMSGLRVHPGGYPVATLTGRVYGKSQRE